MQEQNIFLDIAPYIGTTASHPANGRWSDILAKINGGLVLSVSFQCWQDVSVLYKYAAKGIYIELTEESSWTWHLWRIFLVLLLGENAAELHSLYRHSQIASYDLQSSLNNFFQKVKNSTYSLLATYTASAKLSTFSTTNSPEEWNNSSSNSLEYSLLGVWNALSTQHTTVCNKIRLFSNNLLCQFYHPCTKKWFLLIQECM